MTIFLKTGDIIKHKAFLDVAFEVTRAFYGTHDMVVCGLWVNQGFTRTWVIDTTEHWFRISEEQKDNWLVCEKPRAVCIRGEKWVKIKGAA